MPCPRRFPGSAILIVAVFTLFLSASAIRAQTTAPQAGLRDNTPQVHALTNARIVPAPGKLIENGTVIIRNGVIEAVGAGIPPPADAYVWDYTGLTVYPGFIEPFSQTGIPEIKPEDFKGVTHWNNQTHPQLTPRDLYQSDATALGKLREAGFTVAAVTPDHGLFSGSVALVALGDGTPNETFFADSIAHHIRLIRNPRQGYPVSMMGVIAMIRQTLLDARWYQDAREAYRINPRQRKPEENAALAALEPALRKKAPVWISVEDEHAFLRAARIAREFGLNLRVRGSGYEYRMLDPIKSVGAPVILPVNFPRAEDMKVDTPEDALEVSLEELRHWDAAPENPARLHRAGVTFAFTGYGLKKSSDFHVRIREAIRRGLPHDAALAALTTVPARLLGMDARLGAVEPGKRAFLTVTDGPVFAEKTRIRDVWINGRRHEVNPAPVADPGGNWTVTLSLPGAEPLTVTLDVKGAPGKFRGNLTWNEEKIDLTRVSLDMKRISFLFPGEKLGHEGVWRLSGSVDGAEMGGKGALPDGRGLVWSARLDSSATAPEPAAPVAMDSVALPAPSPAVAFGRSALPTRPKNALVRGATIWTLDSRGKIENADMLITDGKITRIGSNLAAPPDALIIDGKGKHITPGLIDAHSHTAITQGINESSQAVTAEVDIGDIIDSYDIALYRELAGGLTTANVLHGSANPIGGKNQVIKLRWGASPDEMKFEGATPGIKFALGENVKQSNAPTPTSRYPQTRMGVEQIIRDRFRAAQEYERAWKTYEGRKDKRGVIPPRRDLELETLAEILRGERLVHCHSYRQDEILMMIRIADDFGFRIGTFQHVLEGYKVAAEIARHGAGASTFSDWWAFKIEANDAIPHNGALMNRAGVLVTFNSDSDELARRLNTEAAKAVKYGGVDEVEALKFVTLNAARQLRIDNRVGSLEEGKDADFVVWNGHPLSTYTACEQTWIDGRRYFDRNEDTEMRKQVEQERASLIQKILSPEKKEEKKPGPSS